MRITTLIENDALEDREDLSAEFGLSLHVQVGERQILFDTGTSGAFAANAQRLGIDVGTIDAAVVSHQHFDHAGGLKRFLADNTHATVYLRQSEPAQRYFKAFGLIKRPIGLDTSILERIPERFEFVSGTREILPGVVLITDIGTVRRRPKGNRRLFVERDGKLVRDPFDHELLMVIREDDGMVVFTGCSHSGVLNMVDAARAVLPDVPIKAIIGGFHLVGLPQFNTMAASRREVEEIGRSLMACSPRVYTAHCTGAKGYEVLAGVMGDTLEPFHTGSLIEV
jgi:7,8-dihydropterin-6-yl-methyl-4-(beta-D-ribofuranosyl)aminobenzene 5'-phosphate synthase